MTRILKRQDNASPERGLPVDDKNTSSTIQSITGETAQMYYWTGGTRTIDAGQLAGVVVEAQLAFNNIKNASGGLQASFKDTSLSFTSTALTEEVEFPWEQAEIADASTGTVRATTITSGFTNGQYCVDYTKGTIYGVKASTQVTLTSTAYKVQQAQAGGGGGVATQIDVTKLGGTDINIDDTAFAVGTDAVLPTGFLADETTPDSVDEGDTGIARMTLDRKQIIASESIDDAAFTAASYISQSGFLADETTPDSVDEGDVGIARMTLDRKQITASEHKEDAAHSSGDYGTHAMGVRNDQLAGLSGADGDYTPVQMDADGATYVNANIPIAPTHISPIDGAVAYTSTTTITCSGFPFTVADANCYITHIDYYPTGSTFVRRLVNGVGGISMKAAANVITLAGGGAPFVSADTYFVGIKYQEKAFVAATNSDRTGETDPIDEHYTEPELVDTTNLAADTYYYPSSTGMVMGNFNNISQHMVMTGGVTVTHEAKIDDSTDWVDITPAGYRLDADTSGNVSYIDQTAIVDFDDIHVRNFRTKVVTADNTNGIQLHSKYTAV